MKACWGLLVKFPRTPDVIYQPYGYAPASDGFDTHVDAEARTGWYSLLEGSAPVELTLHSSLIPPDEDFTLVVTIGIAYGMLKTLTEVELVPNGGSAKVIEVG